jgi:hypothetical protein
VLAAGFFFHVSSADWCWIILAISIVWTAEALNTAFEFLADAASPEFHPLVRDAKDVAAGAVLVTAGAAAVIGTIVFWPYVSSSRGRLPAFFSPADPDTAQAFLLPRLLFARSRSDARPLP